MFEPPVKLLYDPEKQSVHEDDPGRLEYFPSEQYVHLVDPDPENVPALQTLHSSDVFKPRAVEYFPAAHSEQNSLWTTIEYFPSGQRIHTLDPDDE
jgi:hypothetical protein